MTSPGPAGAASADPDAPTFQRLTTGRGLTYQPGLDGLRGIAVVVIVLFHLGLAGVSGGYLAVTLFFTLSGLLIGSLVLHEITTTGRFSLRRFWLRRPAPTPCFARDARRHRRGPSPHHHARVNVGT